MPAVVKFPTQQSHSELSPRLLPRPALPLRCHSGTRFHLPGQSLHLDYFCDCFTRYTEHKPFGTSLNPANCSARDRAFVAF